MSCMWQDVADRCSFAWSTCLLPALWWRFRATDETLEEDEGALRAVERSSRSIEMLLERAIKAVGNSLKGDQSQEEDVTQEAV